MQSIITEPVFQAYVASALALGTNLLVLANNTALTRTKADEVVNPEDKVLNGKATVVYEDGNDRTERYRRAHRNALENIPLFLVTGFLLAMTGSRSRRPPCCSVSSSRRESSTASPTSARCSPGARSRSWSAPSTRP